MELKTLSLQEKDQVAALFLAVFTRPPWNDDWSLPGQLDAYLTDLMGNPNSLSLGLEEDGRLLGLALGSVKHWHHGTEYCVEEFCIAPDCQGRGLGSRFLEEIQRWLAPRGILHLFLQTERTAPAYEFYRKNGFTELTDHVSLAKTIDPPIH